MIYLALFAGWAVAVALILLWFHQATHAETPPAETPRDDWAIWSGELGDAPAKSIHPSNGEDL